MAIVVTSIFASGDDTDGTTYTTASHTYVSGRTYVLFIGNRKATSPPNAVGAAGITGGPSWTFNAADNILIDSIASPLVRFRGFVATGGGETGALSWTFAATQEGCIWALADITGNDTTTPVVQRAVGSANSGTALSTATLAAFGSVNNGTLMAGLIRVNNTLLPDTGWTAAGTAQNTAPNLRIAITWRADNDTTPTMTAGASTQWAAFGWEIAAAGGGGGGVAILAHGQRTQMMGG